MELHKTTGLSLKFDGEALKSGRIDLAILVPALECLQKLILESNEILNDSKSDIRILVTGFEPGSFKTNLEILYFVKESMALLATNPDGIQNILEALGFLKDFGGSLIDLYKALGGERPTEIIKGNGNVIVKGNNNSITVNAPVYNLYEAPGIRESLAGLMQPLHVPGIDSIQFTTGQEAATKIEKNDVHLFNFLESEEAQKTDEGVRRVTVGFKKLILPLRSQCLFKMSGFEFSAKITDPTFLERVESGVEEFRITDSLDVDLRRTKLMAGTEKSYKYEIERVHRHIRGPSQTEMHL